MLESAMIYRRLTKGVRDHFYVRRGEWACAAIVAWYGFFHSELICLVLGLVRLAALVINGTYRGYWYSDYSPYVRMATAYMTSLAFLLLWLKSPLLSSWSGVFITLCILDGFNACGTAKESGWQWREGHGGGPTKKS